MKKSVKSIISMIMVLTMIFAFSATAFAASGFHKVNGIGNETGASGTYTSTTTVKCSRITAQGTSDNMSKSVILHIYSSSNKLVASKVVLLNGKEVEVVNFYTPYLNAGTYRIEVQSSDNIGYEVSTFFYQ